GSPGMPTRRGISRSAREGRPGRCSRTLSRRDLAQSALDLRARLADELRCLASEALGFLLGKVRVAKAGCDLTQPFGELFGGAHRGKRYIATGRLPRRGSRRTRPLLRR